MAVPESTGRQQDGTFAPGISGNPQGRPRGSRHKATVAAQLLLDGEAASLTRRAIEMALSGDSAAMRLCLERLIPSRKETPITVSLPTIANAADTVIAQSQILAAAANGEITPSEANALSQLVESVRKSIETQELEFRIRTLEERTNA